MCRQSGFREIRRRRAVRTGRGNRAGAFTLMELLVVMAIMAVLGSILSSSFVNLRSVVRRIICGSNQRQLALAWRSCAADRKCLPVAETGGVEAWQRNAEFGNTTRSITDGALWPYSHELALYRCAGSMYDYYVSYAISARLNGADSAATTIEQISNPADTMLLIEEFDNRDCNLTSFQIDPRNYIWIDVVAGNHEGGDNLTFVDGRVEYWLWRDPRTLTFEGGHYVAAPDSVDLDRLDRVYNTW